MAPKKKPAKGKSKPAAKMAAKPAAKPATKPVTKTVTKNVAAAPLPLPPMPAKAGDASCATGCGCGSNGGGLLANCMLWQTFTSGRTWLAGLIATLVFWAFDFWWHGHLLAPQYAEAANLWRPEMDLSMLFGAQLLSGMVFGALYARLKPKGVLNGARAGLLLSLMWLPGVLTAYVTQPIPADLAQMWALGSVLEGVLAGMVVALFVRGCGCGGNCACKGNCGPNCACGSNCGC